MTQDVFYELLVFIFEVSNGVQSCLLTCNATTYMQKVENFDDGELDLARKLSQLLTEKGTHPPQQTALLTELCGLSTSQARRKLQGASWSFSEVARVASYLGVSLDSLLADNPKLGANAPRGEVDDLRLPAVFHLDGSELACSILLGPKFSEQPSKGVLVGVVVNDEWHVGESGKMAGLIAAGMAFQIEELLVRPESNEKFRVAFLDDDRDAVVMLAEWFNEVGYRTEAFATTQALLAQPLEKFDAFVVDFLLARGESAHDLIKEIRGRFPRKPIMVLTGKLQDGTLSESDLVPTLRTMNVLFFEKPVRPSVLAAALQNALDQSGE